MKQQAPGWAQIDPHAPWRKWPVSAYSFLEVRGIQKTIFERDTKRYKGEDFVKKDKCFSLGSGKIIANSETAMNE